MKTFFATLTLASVISAPALAADCLSAEGFTIPNGTTQKFYYVSHPRQKIGPNYRCAKMVRERTCVNGELTDNTPACSQYDSGGCVDNWLEMMSDSDFNYLVCED